MWTQAYGLCEQNYDKLSPILSPYLLSNYSKITPDNQFLGPVPHELGASGPVRLSIESCLITPLLSFTVFVANLKEDTKSFR